MPLTTARIKGIEAFAVDLPLTRNFGGSTYSVLKRSTVEAMLQAIAWADMSSSPRATATVTGTSRGSDSEAYHSFRVNRRMRKVVGTPCPGGWESR